MPSFCAFINASDEEIWKINASYLKDTENYVIIISKYVYRVSNECF